MPLEVDCPEATRSKQHKISGTTSNDGLHIQRQLTSSISGIEDFRAILKLLRHADELDDQKAGVVHDQKDTS
jgi:hypothetical protein